MVVGAISDVIWMQLMCASAHCSCACINDLVNALESGGPLNSCMTPKCMFFVKMIQSPFNDMLPSNCMDRGPAGL